MQFLKKIHKFFFMLSFKQFKSKFKFPTQKKNYEAQIFFKEQNTKYT